LGIYCRGDQIYNGNWKEKILVGNVNGLKMSITFKIEK